MSRIKRITSISEKSVKANELDIAAVWTILSFDEKYGKILLMKEIKKIFEPTDVSS